MKIAVIGYSGSGKSTLSRQLADFYRIPVLFLDAVHFLPGWVERDAKSARVLVADFMRNPSWVIDGNYDNLYQAERLRQADKIVFLDFPRAVCLLQALKRYVQNKNAVRESMADGCIEKMDAEFLWWILHEGRNKKRRGHYRRIVSLYHAKTIVLKNRKQLNAYLRQAVDSVQATS